MQDFINLNIFIIIFDFYCKEGSKYYKNRIIQIKKQSLKILLTNHLSKKIISDTKISNLFFKNSFLIN
ncbi:hypothetical protein BafPKo_J0010 (plasmid) [Borreliella afzelii PKo]|uniref:Uncharacterized protein n=1 Tax=Borreliella afzelii (strain PKo) TaxID=390236 RepID=G0ITY7_BORAP|nr:hypothetical protein BafPKo_J0010 [Borreliella afzelii PKo]